MVLLTTPVTTVTFNMNGSGDHSVDLPSNCILCTAMALQLFCRSFDVGCHGGGWVKLI